MNLNELFSKKSTAIIFEGGNLASHTSTGAPTVGWTGIPGTHTAGKIDSQNRAAMQPAVKQLLVDINNTFTRQYGRPIWSHELLQKEVETFISGSSKWFMMLRQPNPNFDPKQPVSDANPKEIGVTDKDFQRVKKKVGDIDTQIDRRLEPQIEEFVHKNIGKSVGSATLIGTKKGSDQWLALWQLNEPPITLQVDLEFVDYVADKRGFEVPTEWAQVSHGSAWEDLEAGMKGVFRQWLYRSLAKVAPTDKYIAKLSGAGKKRGVRLFGGDDGKEPVVDLDSPPPPFHDANFSFAVASVGGGGVRAKYRQPTPEENVPLEINGVPVMVPLTPAESNYIKDMGEQFEQFFGEPAKDNETKMMASFVGSIELMKQYFTPEQQQIAIQEFLKINFGPGAQMIEADNPTEDFKIKIIAIDYLLDQTGMKGLRKQALQMAKEYETAFSAKKASKPVAENFADGRNPQDKGDSQRHGIPKHASISSLRKIAKQGGRKGQLAHWQANMRSGKAKHESLSEAEVKAQLRKGMPHLRDLKPADFLDLVDELQSEGGRFKLENIPLNVKIDGFGGRFGKNAEGKPFMGTSRTEPRYSAGFVDYHKQKGTNDPEILGRAANFDKLFNEIMTAIKMVDSKLGSDFLIDKQVTCEILFLPFATQTEEGKLKFVGIEYDQLPKGVDLVLVPYRIVDASTGEDIPDGDSIVQQIAELGQSGNVMFMSNRLTQKEGLDVTEIINPLENLEELKQIVSDTAGKRDRASLELRREVETKLKPIQLALEKAIDEDPNIVGKDNLGQDYEGIVINSRLGPIKVTSQRQKDIITAKNAAKAAARTEQPRENQNKTAVVAIGSFIGHKGHEELFNYTINKAKELGGDPYLFIGNAEGKDDPIPPAVKVQTWHKLYPEYAKNISTVTQQGGTLIQKIKHELINPLPGKPPRYDNIVIMVGEDRAGLNMPNALMKAVNKFQGYEHVKVSLGVTPRGTGISGTMLRNSLKNDAPEKALAVWSNAFDVKKLGVDWIKNLMDITRKGMGIQMPQQPQQKQAVPERLFNALIYPKKLIVENEVDEIFGLMNKPKSTVKEKPKLSIADMKVLAAAADKNRAKHPGKVYHSPEEYYKDQHKDLKAAEGLGGAVAGGVGGALLTKTPSGAIAGAELGSDVQDYFAKEDDINEVGEPTTDYYTLGNGKMVQVKYRPNVNQSPIPFTDVNVSYVNPALKPQGPSFDSTGQSQRWDAAPDGVKQAIEKFVKQPQKAVAESEQKTVAKTWDQMTSQEKLSGVKGRTVWNEKTRKYYTVFDVPAKQETKEASLGNMLSWPEVVNKVNSAMKAMGWTGKRQGDDAFMFSTKGAETDDQWYIVIIESEGNNFFSYALGTVEDGDPHIDDAYKGQLPNTEASVSELMNEIREGFGLEENLVRETDKKKGADGKACWDGYRYNGTENGSDKCVKVSENIELKMFKLIKLLENK